MSFSIIDTEQGTPEWLACRVGRLTGSTAGAMLAKPQREGEGMRHNLKVKLALERILGRSLESSFQTKAMEEGTEREDDARMAYEIATGNPVFVTGFLSHDTLMVGASLDGHLGDFNELVSIKCRQEPAHWAHVQKGTIPKAALEQMRHELWLTGAVRHHYVSWNPNFPEKLQLRVKSLTAKDLDIDGYAAAAMQFLKDVDAEVEAIRALERSAA